MTAFDKYKQSLIDQSLKEWTDLIKGLCMNNRLDFISAIDPEGIELMKDIRQAFINLDDILRHFSLNENRVLDGAGHRTLALARTNLETSLQYAIKTLCLQYEIKSS